MSARESVMNAPDADLEADPVSGAELSVQGIFASTRAMLALGNDAEAEMARMACSLCSAWAVKKASRVLSIAGSESWLGPH